MTSDPTLAPTEAPEPPSAPADPTSPTGDAAPEVAADAAPEVAADAASEIVADVVPEVAAPTNVMSEVPVRTVRLSDYQSDRRFADFPISPEVLQGVESLGYALATPVQAMSIEPALAGRDLLVRAKTGTGKTCAFCLPMIERIPAGDRRPRGIVLAPTRELALQVAQECAAIASFKDIGVCCIYGGVGFGPQEDALRAGVEIVVGTPGRILDHMRRGNLDLSGIQVAVLDEADEMLSMGFLEDVRKILDRTPKERQTLLFSATVNESVKSIIGRYLRDPLEIMLSTDGDNVSSVTHVLYESSPDYHKARALLDLLELEKPTAALIFCNTREDVNTVCAYLERQGLNAELISGELPQPKRERVMARVKAGTTRFLVATDVAARGIDISMLSHVINYALPDDPAIYLHRIGRTGRIGKLGTAITLAGGADFSTRLTLERQHKIVFEIRQLPTLEESTRLRVDRITRTLKDAAGQTAWEAWRDVAGALRTRPDGDMLIAVALRAFFEWDTNKRREIAERDDGGSAPSDDGPRPEGRGEPRGERRDSGRPRDGERRDGGRGERARDERPREDRPREERPREERPREDRPREERAREERPREDRPREDRAREERPREERPARDGRRGRDGAATGDRDRRGDRPRRTDGARDNTGRDNTGREGALPQGEPPSDGEPLPPSEALDPITAPVAEGAPPRTAAPASPLPTVDDPTEEDTEPTDPGATAATEAANAGRKRRRRRRGPRRAGDVATTGPQESGGDAGGEGPSGESGGTAE